jgi:UDP-N-acetylglucosamine 2-epimerase
VVGDVNSTLATALVSAKLGIRFAHVEAGLRSFDRRMPEEVNRVVTDHLSRWCFAPTPTAVTNLAAEGIVEGVHRVGDLMQDLAARVAPTVRDATVLDAIGERLARRLVPGGYLLATVHRAENTNVPDRLAGILAGLGRVTGPVVLAAHPRMLKAIRRDGLALASNLAAHPPFGYVDMCRLLQAARLVLTDSGGLQKEAYWVGTPCVTLRDETEWVETIASGWNTLVGADPARIADAACRARPSGPRPILYGGDGAAASRCVSALEDA